MTGGTPLHRQQCRSNLLWSGSGEFRHAHGDAVIAVSGMPAQVAINAVSHVNELFRDHDFQRSWLSAVEPRQIDQDKVLTLPRQECVGAANRGAHPPAQPRFELTPLRSHPQMIDRKAQTPDIVLDVPPCLSIRRLPAHGLTRLKRTGSSGPTLPFRHISFACGTLSSYRIAGGREGRSCERPGKRLSTALQRPHVLIVSDDQELSDFLGEGLVYAGLWTSVIAGALQALEVFRLRSFDLLLLDAALGGIGAAELIRRLRGLSDRASSDLRTDIPIVIVAAAESELDTLGDAATVAEGVVLAPIALEDLAPTLQTIVQSWRERHPDRPWADAAALEGL